MLFPAAATLAIAYGWRPVAGLLILRRAQKNELPYSSRTLVLSFAVTAFQLLAVGWIFGKDIVPILIGKETALGLIAKSMVAIAVMFGVDVVCMRIGSPERSHTRVWTSPEVFDRQVATQSSNPWFWLYCVPAAATEELLFRGIPLHHAHESALVFAVCASSVLFAAQHARNGVAGLGYRFFFGVLFGCQFLLFSQLLPVIIGHLAGNWRVLFAAKRMLAAHARDQQFEHSALRM